jgi:hypothetical protein
MLSYLLEGNSEAWIATGIFIVTLACILDMALQWYGEALHARLSGEKRKD